MDRRPLRDPTALGYTGKSNNMPENGYGKDVFHYCQEKCTGTLMKSGAFDLNSNETRLFTTVVS